MIDSDFLYCSCFEFESYVGKSSDNNLKMEEETTFGKLKKCLFELLRGYPDYRFFGKVEYFLGQGQSSLNVLNEDKIITLASKKEAKKLNESLTSEQFTMLKAEGKKEPVWYRLAPRGVDLAVSMINLEHSERMSAYTKETNALTKILTRLTNILLVATIVMIVFAFAQLIITLWG